MKEVIIHNWDDLQREIFDGVWDDKIMRYRNNCVYRGCSDKNWSLRPFLNRVCKHDLSLEKQMLRSFRKYGYADLDQNASFWQTVAIAQQYGLPTRLLDFTYSPLVAAHFATEDQEAYDRDGIIWCVQNDKMNAQLPSPLKSMLDEEHCNVFSMEMMDRVAGSFEELKALSDRPFALFFEPASMADRIANQYALFSVCSDVNVQLDQLPLADDVVRKIIIPKEVKLEIRDKLDYINISERMIYPGLTGICKWITRRFADLGPKYNHRPEKDWGAFFR